ncbi:MAG: alpha/beta fold hydrolase [Alphaproteobacteria bacterium]|nr:alpha/beta fold hydrolase [Alphaproteobacteria bacterium]
MLTGPSHIPPHPDAVLILCHGYGSNGADLFDLSPELSRAFPAMGIFCPDAPVPTHGGGFEWFNLDDYPDQADAVYLARLEKRAPPAIVAVQDLMRRISDAHGIPAHRIFVGGFSQGGLVALRAALTYPDKTAGCIGMSALPLVTAGKFRDIPVLLTHGDADDVVPVAAVQATRQTLGGRAQTFISPGMAHAIDRACLREITAWMQKILDARP